MSLEDGARGRKKTGRKESEHSAQCLAHSRYSIFFGVWSSVPGYEVLTTGKPRLRQVYRVLLAGQDCIWFIRNFHVWIAGTDQLLSRSWLRKCECLGQGATTRE